LDGNLGARPRSHIFVASRSPLTVLEDALPRYDAYPPGIDLSTHGTRAPSDAAPVSGSCLCGAVTFAATVVPKLVINCYCSLCRHSHAAAFGSTLLVPRESFTLRSGSVCVRRYALPAPRRYSTEFCGDCGSPVPSVPPASRVAMLPAGAVDTALPPLQAIHLYAASKAPWCDIPPIGDRFDELPPPHRLTEIFQ
jgi:hypothetical protein